VTSRSLARRPVGPFRGLPPPAGEFLAALRENNNTAWFEERREDYERFLVEPMRALAAEFGEWFEAEVDAGLDTRPQVGRAVGRIRRDTRFTADKRPYKETVWIIFRNRRAAMGNLGFYWELTPVRYVYGMGFYSAPPGRLVALREEARADPERFLSLVRPIEACPELTLSGNRYQRTQMPGAPPELVKWLDWKNLYVDAARSHDDLLAGRGLVDLLFDTWQRLAPLYRFLRG
jgi:uncharacterized protein (TIGR02453 family)